MKTKLHLQPLAFSLQPFLFAFFLLLAAPPAPAQTGWGSALDFDGVNDYMSVPLTLPDTGTIEMWYYVEPYFNYQTLFDNSSDPNDWEMWIYASGEVRFQLQDGDCRYDLDNLDGPSHWYHFAVTWQKHGSQADYSLYVNGVQRGAVANQLWVNPGSTFYLAGGNAGNTKGNGKMDEVRIWNVARTATEIQAAMNQRLSGAEAGLVAYWRFDEGTGTTAADTTGHGYTGTLVNGPAWVSSTVPIGPIGQPVLSNFSVAENQAVGTTVGTLSAVDPDNSRTFTFALVAGTGDTDNASFTITGTTLQTAATFDRETKSSYSIRVRATDQGNSTWQEMSFIVTILNSPETVVVMNANDSGAGSLREAIVNGGAGDTITFAPGVTGPINLTTVGDSTYGPSAFAVTHALTIEGNGITLQRDGSVSNLRLFYVSPTGNLTLTNVTLSNGAARGEDGYTLHSGGGGGAGLGGAILNEGTVTIQRSTLNANQAIGGNGGNYTSASGSSGGKGGGPFGGAGGGSGANGLAGGFASGGGGGGLSSQQGTGGVGGFGAGRGGAASAGVTYGGAGGFGGGGGGGNAGTGGGGAGLGGAIFNNAGTLWLVNCTISTNSCSGGSYGPTGSGGTSSLGTAGTSYGGGLFNRNGPVVTVNCTFSGNTAQSSGAGIYSLGDGATGAAALTLRNTIVANSTGANDLQITASNGGSSTSSGTGNLVRLQSGFAGSIVTAANPTLGSLANNGGLTFTHALLPGSPAIDAGDDSVCPATDQRGTVRPQDGNYDGISHCDIGAYEASPPTDIALSPSSVPENQPSETTAGTLTATDSTPGETQTFTLVSGSGDTDNASFTVVGATLKTAASFDYEVKNSYSIRVQATDQGGFTYAKQLTITVTDANDPPVANLATYSRSVNMSLKILISDLLSRFTSDEDGDQRQLDSVGSGTNSATISKDDTYIYYEPSDTDPNRNTADYFSYQVSDGRGGTAASAVRVMVVTGGDPGSQGGNLVGIETVGNHKKVKFWGIPNYAYRVQRTEALNGQSTVWTDLPGTATQVSPGYYEYEDTSPPEVSAAYRTVWP